MRPFELGSQSGTLCLPRRDGPPSTSAKHGTKSIKNPDDWPDVDGPLLGKALPPNPHTPDIDGPLLGKAHDAPRSEPSKTDLEVSAAGELPDPNHKRRR